MAISKLVQFHEKTADAVVGAYKRTEEFAIGSYKKAEDKFVSAFLTRSGETVEEAKERLKKM